tara:strand:- start:2044 stop:2916 length:873 start_codon:yes stop_codon:yes gene_type:complete
LKILVTGADGFTGCHFLKHADLAGHEIIINDTDLRDKDALKKTIRQLEFESVISFAGLSFVGHEDKSELYSVNALGATNLLDAILEISHKELNSIVLVSSAQVYGDNGGTSQIKETDQVAPNNHYAMSKLAMEFMSKTYLDRLPIIFTRPFNYTGPGQALNFVIPKIVDHFARRESSIELGNINVEREYNDIRFVCEAYLALIEYGEQGNTYNLCTGTTYSLKEVLDKLTEITRHDLDVFINDDFVRKNDIQRLCGDPRKLEKVLSKAGISTKSYSLRDTLDSMLRDKTQ